MCGITGIISREIDLDILREMTDTLSRRGPDGQGFIINDERSVALGHTRLKVIDVSEEAAQPMSSLDGNLVMVFNGEIFGFRAIRDELKKIDASLRFRSHSDTEVILNAYQAWGEEFLNQLEGMFAFAIYEKQRHRVLLCRDRQGKKPLFYFSGPGMFIFASEIKSLLKHPAIGSGLKINKQALYNFLHLGYIPEPDTIYESIRKFPAGYYGFVKADGSLDLNEYWKIDDSLENSRMWNEEDAISKVRETLTGSIQKRLISDVPLGLFLSGGTDSSLVAAIASEQSALPLKSFTIGFQDIRYDERVYAGKVARHLKTDHHEYILSESRAMEILENYLDYFDEPFADTSAIPTMLVSELARKDVTVALTGDGGDELFLGYGAYDWANRLENPLIHFLRPPLAWMLKNSGSSRLKRVAGLLDTVPDNRLRSHIFSQEQYFFSQEELRNRLMMDKEGYQAFTYYDPPHHRMNAAEKQALFDLKYYLKDDLLAKVDRASMYHSLECRSPYLDYRLIELAFSLPYSMKKRGNENKWILKQILKKYLPDELIYKPKWGFSIPLGKWLKKDLRFLIENYLNRECIESAGLSNYLYVDALKKSFFKGNDYLYHRLWVLIVLHKWMKEHGT